MLVFFKSRQFKYFFYFFIAFFIVIITTNNVPSRLTKKDKVSIESFIQDLNIDKTKIKDDYNYQISALTLISDKVLDEIKPSINGIPTGQSREPSIQIEAGYGQCFDRSRLIEKIGKYLGFKTRHLYVINNNQDQSFLKALFSSNTKISCHFGNKNQ